MLFFLLILFILFVVFFLIMAVFISNLVKSITYSIEHLQSGSSLYTRSKELSEKYAKHAALSLVLGMTLFLFIAYFLSTMFF